MVVKGKFHLSITRLLALGFAGIILLGALLLCLPVSNRSHEAIPFVDALFTSGSATCVTGLIVYDTFTQFTLFGQIVILLLIQIGGLGFMTIALFFSMLIRKRIGLAERSMLMESAGMLQLGGIVRLMRRVLIGTALIEGLGAILLATRFVPVFGLVRGIYFGVFHSIAAFCNAGFDLMGIIAPYSSLVPFADDVVVNLVISSLIVIGGLGFIVWNDLCDSKFRWRRLRLQSKIVFLSTLILIAGGAAAFFILERNASMAGMSVGERILASLFASVTPRTAGFNTVDMAKLSEGGNALTMLLMLIGASPGSTGGGVKTTTLVVILVSVISYIRHRDELNVGKRRLEADILRRSYCSVTVYLSLTLAGFFALIVSQNIALKDALFETLSAIGTVGLTTGITRSLNDFSRVVITLLMYCGRVGSLTLAMAVAETGARNHFRYPEEKITIG